jgi:acyl-CoA synthetase (AMP-forming)/AMP-acid ligase II/aryl carrier-like protein
MAIAAGFGKQGAGEFGRQAGNLVEVFRARAAGDGDRLAFTFLADDDHPPQDIAYAQLDRRARAIAARLRQRAAPGDRAVLMYDAGLEYVAALAGCLYAGMVAVPAYPPDPLRASRTLPRLEAIVRDAEATLFLGTSTGLAWVSGVLGQAPSIHSLVATDDIDERLADEWNPPRLDRQTLAILQYTSGSTDQPKGVMLTHGNLLHNLAQMEEAIDIDDAIAGLWLPAYHDMGLIGGILQCWYSGRRSVMLSPLAFFQRPLRWLQAISRYRVTTTGAPDFAYDLCVRKIKPQERRELDLTCWRLALSGAEPVRPQTIDRFVESFAGCGVRREIFCPCFGLAEATLMVTCSRKFSPPVVRAFDADQLSKNVAAEADATGGASRTLVGCGRGVRGQRVAIVDPRSRRELPPGHVGEIWVSGSNVAVGYWRRPEQSQATFNAYTAAGSGPFLRTGDVGFVHEGELYISGRLKEVIIIHGRNHYPQDIEQTAERSHEAVARYGCVAFSIDGQGRERLVVVCEVARPNRFDLDEVSRAIRFAVLQFHDLLAETVVLIRRGTIPKTTSGKIQRFACRQQFLDGQLQELHIHNARGALDAAHVPQAYVAPRTPTEAILSQTWAETLDLPRVSVYDNFLDLGGHSLLAAQLVNRLAGQLQVEIGLSDLFERPTIAALAELIDFRRTQERRATDEFLALLESMSDEQAERTLLGDAVPTLPGARFPAAVQCNARCQTEGFPPNDPRKFC